MSTSSTTNAITSPLATLPPTSSSSSTSSSTATASNAQLNLTPTDFLNMMVTQLQNQDPLNPTSSSDLLNQMSQIGQLQSTTSLQTSLTSFGLQTSIASASAMIGKSVQGLDANGNPLSGVVTSVQVQSGNVSLGLDSGSTLALSSVSAIAPAATTTATTTPTTGTTTTVPGT